MGKKILLLVSVIIVAILAFWLVNRATSSKLHTAADVIKDGLQQAAKENKKLFVIFHASWCGWCKKMDTAMNDPVCKKIIANNYVVVHIDVMEGPQNKDMENPAADSIIAKYHVSALPSWCILSPNGKLMFNMVGYPGNEKGLSLLENALKNTTVMSDDQIALVRQSFTKHYK